MSRTVFVNGAYLPEGEAKVSIFDRGFVFGDGVYEVVPVIAGKMIDTAPFLSRLDRSLSELSIDWPMSMDEYVAMHEALITANGLDEGVIYSQVTRGVAERDFAFPKDTPPGVMAFTQNKALLDNPLAKTGVNVAVVDDIRWKRRDVKSIALLAQCIAKQQAAEKGGFEGWMSEDGMVTEGTSSSAYIIKGGTIITRPLSNAILPGIRRKVLLQLAREHQISIEERTFTINEALGADEAFLSSASTFVLPVVSIDHTPIAGGTPGPLTMRLRKIYLDAAMKEAGCP